MRIFKSKFELEVDRWIFKTYISCQRDEYLAIEEVSKLINRQNLVSIICYFTENYCAEKLRLAFRKNLDNTSIIGCTTCKGIMTERGVRFGSVVGIIAIYDSNSTAYASASLSIDNKDEAANATTSAIKQALYKVDRVGEVPSFAIIHSTPGLGRRCYRSI